MEKIALYFFGRLENRKFQSKTSSSGTCSPVCACFGRKNKFLVSSFGDVLDVGPNRLSLRCVCYFTGSVQNVSFCDFLLDSKRSKVKFKVKGHCVFLIRAACSTYQKSWFGAVWLGSEKVLHNSDSDKEP